MSLAKFARRERYVIVSPAMHKAPTCFIPAPLQRSGEGPFVGCASPSSVRLDEEEVWRQLLPRQQAH